MWQLADGQFDQFIANGRCEFLAEYAKPFATLAIVDLLGVPAEDRPEIPRSLGCRASRREPGSVHSTARRWGAIR